MKRTIKLILIISMVVLALISTATLAYYLLHYRPYHVLIKQKIERAAPEHKELPQNVVQLMLRSERKNVLYGAVASNLLQEFGKHKTRVLYWHINGAAWSILLRLHFKEEDIFALWCENVYAAGQYGFNNIAKARYGKQLSELTDREVASILVINRSPMYYMDHPGKLQQRVDVLLNSNK